MISSRNGGRVYPDRRSKLWRKELCNAKAAKDTYEDRCTLHILPGAGHGFKKKADVFEFCNLADHRLAASGAPMS